MKRRSLRHVGGCGFATAAIAAPAIAQSPTKSAKGRLAASCPRRGRDYMYGGADISQAGGRRRPTTRQIRVVLQAREDPPA